MAKLKSGTRIYGNAIIDNGLSITTGGLNVSGITTVGGISGTNIVGTALSISGISTLGSNVIVPSGSVGIGTTNPTSKLYVLGDGYFTGILTANRIVSTIYGEFTGGGISGTNIVGTALSISGISTFGSTVRLISESGFDSSILFREGGLTGQDYFRIFYEGSAGTSPNNLLKIQCADGGDGIIDVTAIAITQLGSVGIKGNANTSYAFTVNGTSLFTGNSLFNGTVDASSFRDTSGNVLLNSTTLGSGVLNSSLTSLGTLGQLNVSGVSTFAGITTVTGTTLFAKDVNVSGVSTFAGITTVTGVTLFSKQLNVSGVSTFAGITTVTGVTLFTKQINASGVITASNFIGSGSGLTGVIGVGTGIYIQNNNTNIGAAKTVNFGPDFSITLSSSGIATVSPTSAKAIIMSLIF